MSPYPGGFTECTCLVLPQCRRPSPTWKGGSASRFCPRTRFFTGRFSRLQLFRYVQASQFARLTDRSHLCCFRRRAAEAFTSELNVRRYLRTHRRYYPPDYRQLAERGLSPRKIHSIVGCSFHGAAFPQPFAAGLRVIVLRLHANLLLPRLSGDQGTSLGRSGRRGHSDGGRHRDPCFAPRAHLAIVLPPRVIRWGSGRRCLLGRGLPGSYRLNWNRACNLLPRHRPTAIANL